MSNLRKVSPAELEAIRPIGDAIYSELRSLPGMQASMLISYIVTMVFSNAVGPSGDIDADIREWAEGIVRSVNNAIERGER